jgi:hypothetical protein
MSSAYSFIFSERYFVKDESEDVISELICIHFAAQSVRDIPELLFE